MRDCRTNWLWQEQHYRCTLFRLTKLSGGSIFIDGQGIGLMGLEVLRKSVSIVPHDPVLFATSIRDNLDPFSLHTDESVRFICCAMFDSLSPQALQVMRVLKLVKMDAVVPSTGEGACVLESLVSENGGNVSSGQRQLLCLARA